MYLLCKIVKPFASNSHHITQQTAVDQADPNRSSSHVALKDWQAAQLYKLQYVDIHDKFHVMFF